MPSNSYDIVVIGNDFAGLVAATLCARRGLRVLYGEYADHRTSYDLGPYHLPVRALPFIGAQSPAVKRVLDELHFAHPLKRKLRESTPSYQLVAPNARVDISSDDEALLRELTRELSDASIANTGAAGAATIAQQLDGVLGGSHTFPPDGFWKRREIGRSATQLSEAAQHWFSDLEDDDVARALVELPAVFDTHCSPSSVSPESRARSLHLWRQGTPRVSGDWDTLRELFMDKFLTNGGEHRTMNPSEFLFGWGGKVTGVRLESGEELGAEHIIAAMPIDTIAELAARKLPKRLSQCCDQISAAGYRYTLNLVVAEAGIPEGMADSVIVIVDPSAPPIGENVFAIHRGETDNKARVVITVEAIAPAPEPGDTLDNVFASLRVGLREHLELVMPFSSEHVLLAHSPHETVPAEGTSGALKLKRPIAPTPVWNTTIDSHLGVSGVPYSVGLKHLTVASSQVLLGLGLEGEFAVGWCAAKLASGGGKRQKEFKGDVLVGAK